MLRWSHFYICFSVYLVPVQSGIFDDNSDVFLVMEWYVIIFYNFSVDGIFKTFYKLILVVKPPMAYSIYRSWQKYSFSIVPKVLRNFDRILRDVRYCKFSPVLTRFATCKDYYFTHYK